MNKILSIIIVLLMCFSMYWQYQNEQIKKELLMWTWNLGYIQGAIEGVKLERHEDWDVGMQNYKDKFKSDSLERHIVIYE